MCKEKAENMLRRKTWSKVDSGRVSDYRVPFRTFLINTVCTRTFYFDFG